MNLVSVMNQMCSGKLTLPKMQKKNANSSKAELSVTNRRVPP